MSDAAVLDLTGVVAGYGGTTVLRDVDLSVRAGEVVALLGANGAGKTTLLRVAAGFLAPTAGSVQLNGGAAPRSTHARARAGLCLIPEGRGVFRDLTVRENLRLQVPPWVGHGDVGAALEAFPVLASRMEQPAGTLSGGEQQMLALSRCFLSDPRIVLLDEVSMGLAPKVVEEIFEALARLTASGVALLIVEQFVAKALSLADRIYLLDRGRVSFSGTPSETDADALMAGYLGKQGDLKVAGS